MKRQRFRRWGLVLAALLTLGLLFHRPVLFRMTRSFIARAAEQQTLTLRYDLAGSIITNLRITNLSATPVESGPIERLEIGSLKLTYSFWGLARNGLPGFLESLSIKDAHIVIDPARELPPEKARKPQSIKFPALIPATLQIQNFNLISRRPGGDLVMKDVNLMLDPRTTGSLRAHTLQVPGHGTWTDLHAEATYVDRNLVVQNFDLSREVHVTSLGVDMSHLDRAELRISFAGRCFGGPARASGNITNLNKTRRITLEVASRGNSLASASEALGFPESVSGNLGDLDLKLSGEASRPVTWSGHATIRVEDFVVKGRVALDRVTADLRFAGGKATVRTVELVQQSNHITGTAEVALPEEFAGFAKLSGTGTLDATLGNLATLSEGSASGAAKVRGAFAVTDGQPGIDVQVTADHATYGEHEVNDANVRVRLGRLPVP
jgi:hypothetical protein